jgi:hypothetical protein
MRIFQNFNEVTSFALGLHQFVTLRKTMMTNNKGQLRKKLLTGDEIMGRAISDQMCQPCFVSAPGQIVLKVTKCHNKTISLRVISTKEVANFLRCYTVFVRNTLCDF